MSKTICAVCGTKHTQCMVTNNGDPLYMCKLHGDIHTKVSHNNPNWWKKERVRQIRERRFVDD